MASQSVPAAKRYRISLLLDAYGELLTQKQRTFLRHYFEEDLSFGEIAREYSVSRQAIFDSVKHGEEALENFERVLRLVELGWARWVALGRSSERITERLAMLRDRMAEAGAQGASLADLDALIAELGGEPEGDEDEAFDAELAVGAESANGAAGQAERVIGG